MVAIQCGKYSAVLFYNGSYGISVSGFPKERYGRYEAGRMWNILFTLESNVRSPVRVSVSTSCASLSHTHFTKAGFRAIYIYIDR